MWLAKFSFYSNMSGPAWACLLKKPTFILPMHAEKWALIQKQGDWADILSAVDVFVADGVGLVWGYQFLTGKVVPKISGIDLISTLIAEAPETPVYLWGTNAKNIKKAAGSYKKSGLNVVGWHDGFSGQDSDILKEIKKSEAKAVFVGMGARRAAELCVRIKKELKLTAMTAGGSFDVASGNLKRAPKLFQQIGLEWLWRMLVDPKRFMRLPKLFLFVWYIIKEKYAKK